MRPQDVHDKPLMINKLTSIARSSYYWLGLIIFALLSEVFALIYQHILDYRPCVVCIHVRIYMLALILIPALALWLANSRNKLIVVHALVTAIMAGLMERSYVLLGTERGWVFGSCDFDLGLPAWLAVEEWLPAFFKVWEPCGYTPVLLFGITMAEALMVLSTGLVLISVAMTLAVILDKKH